MYYVICKLCRYSNIGENAMFDKQIFFFTFRIYCLVNIFILYKYYFFVIKENLYYSINFILNIGSSSGYVWFVSVAKHPAIEE